MTDGIIQPKGPATIGAVQTNGEHKWIGIQGEDDVGAIWQYQTPSTTNWNDKLAETLIEDRKDQNTAGKWQMGVGVLQAALNMWLSFRMADVQERIYDKKNEVLDHKMALEDTLAEKQADLANKKLETETEIAKDREQTKRYEARLAADAKVQINKDKQISKLFGDREDPYYGSPLLG